MEENYKNRWLHCLSAIEFTLSMHGDEDWLRAWVEGDETAETKLQRWIKDGKPEGGNYS